MNDSLPLKRCGLNETSRGKTMASFSHTYTSYTILYLLIYLHSAYSTYMNAKLNPLCFAHPLTWHTYATYSITNTNWFRCIVCANVSHSFFLRHTLYKGGQTLTRLITDSTDTGHLKQWNGSRVHYTLLSVELKIACCNLTPKTFLHSSSTWPCTNRNYIPAAPSLLRYGFYWVFNKAVMF